MGITTKALKTTGAALAFGLMASAATAATCNNGNSGNQLVTFSIDPALSVTCGQGNNPGGEFMGYAEAPSSVYTLTDGFEDEEGDGEPGTFSITLNEDVDFFGVVLKQSNDYGFFQLAGDGTLAGTILSGTWSIDGPGNPANTMNKNDYSHISFYYTPGDNGGNTGFDVPLPASALLLMAGLGGFGVVSRKKRKAS